MNFYALTQTELHNHLLAHGAIGADGTKVDFRKVRKLPGMTDEMAEELKNGCKLYKSRNDEANRKRKIESDPVYKEKRLEGDRKRKKESKENETDAEYERRRERERDTEARYRENRKADSVRYEAAKQAEHERRTTDEFRAKTNQRRAANREPSRKKARKSYKKQKDAGVKRKPYEYTEETRLAAQERRKEKDNYAFYKVQQSAKFHNIKLELTEDDVNNLVKQECHYCGETPAGGVDRKDSNQHYCMSNVLPCCTMCNKMKGGHLPEVFKHLASNVATYASTSVSAPRIYMGDTCYSKLCHSAARRGISVQITKAEYDEIISQKCSYCGCQGPVGVDRVDSDGAYVSSNLYPCCSYCNWMKNDLPVLIFLTQCDRIADRAPIVSTSSELCGCGKQSLAGVGFCTTCYFATHFNKHRSLLEREEYDTVLAKRCDGCNITKQIKLFIEPSASVCLDCQAEDY